jgi:hypothetical protein
MQVAYPRRKNATDRHGRARELLFADARALRTPNNVLCLLNLRTPGGGQDAGSYHILASENNQFDRDRRLLPSR